MSSFQGNHRAVALSGRPVSVNGQRRPIEILTPNEVLALLAACSRRGSAGVRNRALIAVLWRCGLRIDEALEVRPVDVNAHEGSIAVLHGKGDRRRVVGIDDQALVLVELWIARRRKLRLGAKRPLFCTFSSNHRGEQLAQAYVREMLGRCRDRAGVEKRVHPHGLRHTHAAELAGEGVPMNVIRLQLGHSSLATTDRYVNHVAPRAVIDAMRARDWPGPAPAVSSRPGPRTGAPPTP
jgi:site-specific recombinase XerD